MAETIRVGKIELADSKGNVRGTIGIDDSDNPFIRLSSKKGESSVKIFFENDNPGINIDSHNGDSFAWLRVHNDGAAKLTLASGCDFVELPDKSEQESKPRRGTGNPFTAPRK